MCCVGCQGKVFRMGGDEFLIALPDCTLENAQDMAEHVLREVKKSYSIKGNELYVTASVGISLAPVHGTDRSALMKAADTALYTSKDSGKNKFSVFDQEMNRHQLRRMSLEKDLRKALARSEFMVVYQPKWDSFMNVTVGLEALLRWRHRSMGSSLRQSLYRLPKRRALSCRLRTGCCMMYAARICCGTGLR